MKSRILIVCASLLFPVLALGQAATPPPEPGARYFAEREARRGPGHGPDLGMWWKNSEIVRQLQLSDAQVKQIEQTFLNARLKLIDLRADVERQQTLLQPLVDADQMDEAKISAQLDQVLAARNRLEKANAMMMFDIRKVLTVEQWRKLRDLQQQRERTPMAAPRAPGMPGPPPGPGPQGPGPGTPPPPDAPDDL